MKKTPHCLSLYQRAVNECRYEIQNGTLDAGRPFYSRSELCRKFAISLVTAHKVQRSLAQTGLLMPQAGGRFIVTKKIELRVMEQATLKTVRMVGAVQALGEGTYGGRIVKGIRSACAAKGLQFELEFVDVLNRPPGYINANRMLPPHEGLIVMLHQDLAPEVAPVLMNRTSRAVMVNSFFPYRAAVLPDYRTGVHEQFAEAVSRGAEKILYCDRLEYLPSTIITAMREELVKAEGDRLGVEVRLDTSGNYRHIAKMISVLKPDAVFFANDLAAIYFKQHFMPKKRNAFRIIGCDNYGPQEELEHLSTWDTNPFGLGEAAVDLLCAPDTLTRPGTRFVPGKLIIRD